MDAATTPPDLAAVLKKAGLAEFFADCTPSHRREYLKWIGEAKKPETRAKRIGQAAERIGAKAAEEARRRKK
ncbi:MAG TPA: YdeI/OmpD-associated family protein [Opitutaceae bacterium]|jgi:uncharacterized protein YdeI (YjbR/CyaY-like superfamily)|nr:YdeI/OmpD-associated family protein [Opitutaceae bacterium]